MTESTYDMVNRGYRLFLKGKWKSKKTDCSFREIPRKDGSKMRILVVAPKEKKENRPGFLWIHGGGYSTGIPEMDKSYMERLAAEGNCVIVFPD
ncbi:MAG: alpha/beta hydrolase fold domain-containing protein [Lachnospiraceae bacterium]|nr:alpha/beta hydrolase fold domain-containing protein [Lachnospiraceae bacterium]